MEYLKKLLPMLFTILSTQALFNIHAPEETTIVVIQGITVNVVKH